ncbi:UBX domain-containing protein 4 [Halotydeus destructor]|nr:UBX domain-containing protein 4 [Halotydeus destructor]
MTVITVHDDSQFQWQLNNAGKKLVVVDFTASWCGPCKFIAPAFEQLSNRYANGAVFLKVDVDECQDTAHSQSVSAMPTFVFYKEKREVARVQGANATELENKIHELAVPVVEVFTGSGHSLGSSDGMWFNGTIADAIALAKTKNKLFMVFVEDDSHLAKTTSDVIDSVKRNIQNRAVAIRIKTGTEAAQQFTAFYPVPVIPATYLISSSDGVPLEILSGEVSANSLKEKFDKAEDAHKKKMATNSGSTPVVEESIVPGPSGSVDSPVPETVVGDDLSPDSDAPIDDKIERARKKAEEIQRRKANEEKEKERQREIERREVGRAAAQRKRQQEDAEMRDLASQRQQEKLDDQRARQRVLDQIAQDKADRKAKFDKLAAATLADSAACKKESVAKSTVPVDCNSARIQFKLPDGGVLTKAFKPEATLIEARDYLVQEAGLRKFTLSTTYPKRNFTDEDYSKSFRDLELLPSAVLLVLTTGGQSSAIASAQTMDGVWAFFTTLFLPLMALWTSLQTMLGFGGQARSPPAATSSSPSQGQQSGPSGSSNRPRTGPRTAYERDGNVSRLRTIHDKDDDEDNNTWNGNSTQQM